MYLKAIKDLNSKSENIKTEIKDEIQISKTILRDWIIDKNYNFVHLIEIQIIDFKNDIMADNVYN